MGKSVSRASQHAKVQKQTGPTYARLESASVSHLRHRRAHIGRVKVLMPRVGTDIANQIFHAWDVQREGLVRPCRRSSTRMCRSLSRRRIPAQRSVVLQGSARSDSSRRVLVTQARAILRVPSRTLVSRWISSERSIIPTLLGKQDPSGRIRRAQAGVLPFSSKWHFYLVAASPELGSH